MDTKLKNTSKKIILILSIIILCLAAVINIYLTSKVPFIEIITQKNYCSSTVHKDEVINNFSELTKAGIEAHNNSSNIETTLGSINYTYFYAQYYFSLNNFIEYTYDIDNYKQLYKFKNLYNEILDDNGFSLYNDYFNESDEADDALIEKYIIPDSSTYIIKNEQFISRGIYTNPNIMYSDLGNITSGKRGRLFIICYSDTYMQKMQKNWQNIRIICLILLAASTLALIYIIWYILYNIKIINKQISSAHRAFPIYNFNANNSVSFSSNGITTDTWTYNNRYQYNPPKYCELKILASFALIFIAVFFTSYVYRSTDYILYDFNTILLLAACFIYYIAMVAFILHTIFAVYYSIANNILVKSSFFYKVYIFIKKNRTAIETYISICMNKIISVFKIIAKPFIAFFDIISGKKFISAGTRTVEKVIFKFASTIIFLLSISVLAVIFFISNILDMLPDSYHIQMPGYYTNIANILFQHNVITIYICVSLLIYLGIFIFYHYHTQKILKSAKLLEEQIEKMYSGDYQIDEGVGAGTPYEKYIRMVSHIGEVFEQNMRTKIELVTNVSHDLKTPLTSIISYIDLLQRDETLSQEAKDYVNILSMKSDRLKHIVSDLFELAKATSGEITIEKKRLNLNKLLIQTLADLNDNITKSGIDVKLQTYSKDIYILSDGSRIYRILQNLIDNALKYSLLGTRIYIQEIPDKDNVIIKIKNTANYEMDFTKEDVMERFFRGDKSRNSEGNGLGISIAQGFTIACGGTFDIEIDGDQFNAIIIFKKYE